MSRTKGRPVPTCVTRERMTGLEPATSCLEGRHPTSGTSSTRSTATVTKPSAVLRTRPKAWTVAHRVDNPDPQHLHRAASQAADRLCLTLESNQRPPGFNRLSFHYTNEALNARRAALHHHPKVTGTRPGLPRSSEREESNLRSLGSEPSDLPLAHTPMCALGLVFPGVPVTPDCLVDARLLAQRLDGRIRTCDAPGSKPGGLTKLPHI